MIMFVHVEDTALSVDDHVLSHFQPQVHCMHFDTGFVRSGYE